MKASWSIAALLGCSQALCAQVIDFDPLEEPGTDVGELVSYSEDGFTITVDPPHPAGQNLGYVQQGHTNYAGSAGIFVNPIDSVAVLTADSNASFSVVSVDVSRLILALPLPAEVIFTANNGTITHEITQANFGFETFVLPPSFQNITDFSWNAGLTQIDNINIVPAPGPVGLMVCMAWTVAVHRRRSPNASR